jgi:NADH-quinone oxidoreductase subunit N
MIAFTPPAFGPALPEIILAVGALVMVLVGSLRGDKSYGVVTAIGFVSIVLAFTAVLMLGGAKVTTFGGAFVVDGFARFMKALTLIASGAAMVLSLDFLRREKMTKFEYPILIVLATTGMMMMISANDLIALYLGLELQSLSLYILAAMNRDNARSSEAGLKYFVLGALSSGMLLYGASLVYGFTGTVSFPGIAAALKAGSGLGVIIGMVFITAGLAFKISAVPFHMWTPDVYEGAPTPVTAFFAAAPKLAAMALTVRVFIGAFPAITADWRQIIVFVAIASMVLGAFAGIGQRNIKRLMAYSSISHVGYALVGLAAGTLNGVNGVIVYMTIYLAMTIGVFACILAMRTERGTVEEISDLSGLSRTQPVLAFCLAMLMFSLTGIPPLAGFFAKFYVFAAAIEAKLFALAVIGVVASVVGAYYYLRIVKVMYFDAPRDAFVPMALSLKAVLAVSSVVVMLFWLMPSPLIGAAMAAAKSLF